MNPNVVVRHVERAPRAVIPANAGIRMAPVPTGAIEALSHGGIRP